MKKSILSLLVLCSALMAQNQTEAEKICKEGITLHDAGKYEEAIVKYEEALKADKDNLLALAEKAYSLTMLNKLEEAAGTAEYCISKHKGDKELRMVYITYANALDMLKKPERALMVYDEAIGYFPDFYFLYYNKGVTLNGLKRYSEALTCFEKSANNNPNHASSQSGLAFLLAMENKKIPSLLASIRFLVLEPKSERSGLVYNNLMKQLNGNSQKTGKNSFSITLDPKTFADTTLDGKNKENNFDMTEMLVSLSSAIPEDKKLKKLDAAQKLTLRLQMLAGSLKSEKKKNFGLYWDYYAPYLIAMDEAKMITTFSYIAMVSTDDKDVAKWIKANSTEIENFYKWDKSYVWNTQK